METNRRGFGVAEIVIAIVVICLIGALGWFAYTNLGGASKDDNATSAQIQNQEEDTNSETAGWQTATYEEYGFSYKFPSGDDWTSLESIIDTMVAGHLAQIGVKYTKCNTDCGHVVGIGVYGRDSAADPGPTFGVKQMLGNNYYTLTSTKDVEKNTVRGTRWEYTPGDDTAVKIVYYYFSKGDFSYAFTINANGARADAVDLTAIGEKIMSTLQFTN